jgi:hypothetical protein
MFAAIVAALFWLAALAVRLLAKKRIDSARYYGVAVVGAFLLHHALIAVLPVMPSQESSSSKAEQVRQKLLKSLLPIGAAAMCMKRFGERSDITAATAAYNARNGEAMKNLVAEIQANGGLSGAEKELIDRHAYRAATEFLDQGEGARATCEALPARINAREFDL